ncbi:MAG: ImmA/IrrE family metallo-endopeptidase [Armatimonadaceae bacterium]
MNLFDDEIVDEPGMFSRSRLIVARTRRGLSQSDLAVQLRLDKTTIARYEKGERHPDIETTLAIADLLGYPYSFFFEGHLSTEELEGVSFRSRRSEIKMPTRLRTISAGHLAAGVINPAVQNYFHLPDLDIPDYKGVQPELAAQLLRAEWGISQYPIKNLVHLLEAKGVRIFWFDEEDTSVDAVSFYFHSVPFVLISQRNRGGERVRMDLAHELGHLVLHRGVENKSIKEVEEEATSFASAFLVPGESFRRENPTFPQLSHLFTAKARWQVSVQALIRRCFTLGIYTETQYRNAIRKMYDNGWRTSEPNQLEWEHSRIFEKVFTYLREQNQTAYDFAREIHLPMDELESLLPIAKRFKQSKSNDLQRLTLEELGYIPPDDAKIKDR